MVLVPIPSIVFDQVGRLDKHAGNLATSTVSRVHGVVV